MKIIESEKYLFFGHFLFFFILSYNNSHQRWNHTSLTTSYATSVRVEGILINRYKQPEIVLYLHSLLRRHNQQSNDQNVHQMRRQVCAILLRQRYLSAGKIFQINLKENQILQIWDDIWKQIVTNILAVLLRAVLGVYSQPTRERVPQTSCQRRRRQVGVHPIISPKTHPKISTTFYSLSSSGHHSNSMICRPRAVPFRWC